MEPIIVDKIVATPHATKRYKGPAKPNRPTWA